MLTQLIRQWGQTYADRVLQVVEGEERSYREVYDRAFRLVRGLYALGIEPGDRVAVLSSNSAATIEQLLALHLGGFARVGMNARNSATVHEYMLDYCGARAIIFDDEQFALHGEKLERPNTVQIVVGGGEGAVDYERLIAEAPDGEVPNFPGSQVSQLQFTSGTSGRPKAAVHNHDSWLGLYRAQYLAVPGINQDDVYLAAGPLTHAASTLVYTVLAQGGCVVVMPHFDPETALDLIERHRCSLSMMVPTMIQMLVSHPGVADRDLSSLRAIQYAGSPMPPSTLMRAHEVLGHVLYQSYGQSEAVPATALTGVDHARLLEEAPERLRSAGRPLPDAVVRIIDDEGNFLPPGAIGEIAIRCGSTMVGFFDDPELTASRFTPDGLVKTSDVGYLDEEGYLFVVDRKGDMIISGGYNIWPAEIENALARHPAVVTAAVFGTPHEVWGETPQAVVVVKEGEEVSEEELVALVVDELGSMKKPRGLVITHEMGPLSSTGKVVRRVWRDHYFGTGAEGDTGAEARKENS